MKKQNVLFNVGDKVVCTWGTNKGKVFIIELIMKESYSCSLADKSDNKYYEYTDSTLEKAE